MQIPCSHHKVLPPWAGRAFLRRRSVSLVRYTLTPPPSSPPPQQSTIAKFARTVLTIPPFSLHSRNAPTALHARSRRPRRPSARLHPPARRPRHASFPPLPALGFPRRQRTPHARHARWDALPAARRLAAEFPGFPAAAAADGWAGAGDESAAGRVSAAAGDAAVSGGEVIGLVGWGALMRGVCVVGREC